MTSSGPISTSQQSISRKRTTSERIIPAIPLALSKPRAAKPKPSPVVATENSSEHVSHDGLASEGLVAQEPASTVSAANGDILEHVEAAITEGVASAQAGVTMPAADRPGSRGSAAVALSFGGTPELQDAVSSVSGAPDLPQASVPNSPAPTDAARSEMRQIRTELPPAFVPSAGQHTPKSASSTLFNRPLSFQSHAGPTRPINANIAFGGHDSSTSSPAPPQSANSSFASPTHANFQSMQQPYFTQHGHAHHASEPRTNRQYHPGYHQQPASWNQRQSYMPPTQQGLAFHTHGTMPFRYSPRDMFTPPDSQQTNGLGSRSGSASRTSSVAPEHHRAARSNLAPLSPITGVDGTRNMPPPDARPTNQAPQHHSRASQYSQVPPPQYQHPELVANMANAEAMRAHVLEGFPHAPFSDCQLHIAEDGRDNTPHVIDGHRIILSRSPTLLRLFETSATASSSAYNLQVKVHLSGQYLRVATLMGALEYLYGGPLPRFDHQRPGLAGDVHISSNVERMQSALQHVAVGAWLKIYPIANRGVEIATSLLHWETIATALAFALEGGLSPVWNVDDGSEDRASDSSSEDSPSGADTPALPKHDPYATHLLHRIVDFIVHVLPTNFYLNTAAPQLGTSTRLQSTKHGHESQRSQSDPRLSQIRFGEISVDDRQRPSLATTTVSSILLSLPFQILKCVLEHYELSARLGPETVASIMRQVIAERESRRLKLIHARTSGENSEAEDSGLVQNLSWAEHVEHAANLRAGFRLARRKRDLNTPPSSGACSERNK